MSLGKRLRILEQIEQEYGRKFDEITNIKYTTIKSNQEGKAFPSYENIVKILEAYPTLNARWLLLGEAPMYIQGSSYGESIGGTSLVEENAVEYMRGSSLYNFPLLVLEVEYIRKTLEELRKTVQELRKIVDLFSSNQNDTTI